MVFVENNPGFAEFANDGDSITGTLIKVEEDVGVNKSKLYTLMVQETPTNVWGSTILDQRMVGVRLGDTVRITYKGLGEKRGGNNPPKIFKVEIDKPEQTQNTQEQSPVTPTGTLQV